MAAVFSSILTILMSFLLFSSSSHAGGDSVEMNNSAFELSYAEFIAAKQDLEFSINKCSKGRKTIPFSIIKKLGMSDSELRVALYVLNHRAEVKCENGAREKLFYTAAVHRQTSKHYNKDPGEASEYDEKMMLSHYWKHYEFKSKYGQIEEEKRSAIEGAVELKVPFLVLETMQDIETQ